jgi:predicted ATPase
MSKIKIKNFGPIGNGLDINDGFIDIKKITIFIGNQATGKSTIVKIYSVFLWLEKMLYRDTLTYDLVKENFVNSYCAYQGLELFFKDDTYLYYKGKAFSFIYENQQLEIIKSNINNYLSPQVVYTPAERNFLSSINNPTNLKNLPKILSAFLSEFEKAKEDISNIQLPLDNLIFEYEKETKKSFIGGNNHKIPLSVSASGVQSLLPIYLISKFFSGKQKENNTVRQISLEEQNKLKENLKKILSNNELSDEIRETAIKALSPSTN